MKHAVLVFVLGLLAPGFLGCGTTAPPVTANAQAKKAPTPAELAAAVVMKGLTACKERDELTFKSLLSKAKLDAFNATFWSTWTAEMKRVTYYETQGFNPAGDGKSGTVQVSLAIGGSREATSVRVVLEGDEWRWNEN